MERVGRDEDGGNAQRAPLLGLVVTALWKTRPSQHTGRAQLPAKPKASKLSRIELLRSELDVARKGGARCPLCAKGLADLWAELREIVNGKPDRPSWRAMRDALVKHGDLSGLSPNTVQRHAREHDPEWRHK